jgi:hypothetical protein
LRVLIPPASGEIKKLGGSFTSVRNCKQYFQKYLSINPAVKSLKYITAVMNSVKVYTSSGSSFKTAIPPTIKKALVEFWGSEEIVEQPEIIVDLGAASISRINRIGRKSLRRIAHALDTFGYIGSSHLWLHNK